MSTPQFPGQSWPGQPNPHTYNPYGSPYPPAPAPDPQPLRRPGLVVLSLVLMVIAALPFLVIGVALLLIPLNAGSLPSELVNSPRLQEAGATPELLVSATRIVGGVLLGVAVIYVLLGLLAFAGRNWARIAAAILTAGFALLLVAGIVGSGGAIDTVSISAVLLVMILGAVAVLFSPRANAWYAYRR
ncbi:MAG TPA: hypothetical protein VGE11_16080 [Pseudonocardia sp.]